MESPTARCQLCERPVGTLTIHHLVPKSQATKGEPIPTAAICSACHRQLHALFTNKQLAREFSSLEELRTDPHVQRFLRWVRQQDSNKRVKVRRRW
ncbi:MAG: HNH endonuclease [Armatimonadota bacterium]|nr:HNH endonuclease [Armatimonadota bacterium]